MAWKTKGKTMTLHSATPHACYAKGVSGRAPGFGTIFFAPLELYGAIARCSEMTPDYRKRIRLAEELIRYDIDDVSNEFAILNGGMAYKDFLHSSFVATLAAGLSYLAMIRDGYVWVSHFENLRSGNLAASRAPDFVYGGRGAGVALVEAKGTKAAKLGIFDKTVEDGYTNQIGPHLGHPVGGSKATHGYSIGSWLTSSTKAQFLVHHTAAPAAADPDPLSQAPPAILRENYATALALAHSERLGNAIRDDGGERSDVEFAVIRWSGRTWLTRLALPYWDPFWHDGNPGPLEMLTSVRVSSGATPLFAIEQGIAETVLARFHSLELSDERERPIEPLESKVREEDSQSGTWFPDGLAVIRGDFEISGTARWSSRQSRMRYL